MKNTIIETFAKSDIVINDQQAQKFLDLYNFMIEYNKNVNLTSITEFNDVVVKHFVDSILPFTMTDIPSNSCFIDVGTGAGYPGIPLIIFRPDLKGTLCDSLEKRCVYLRKVCAMLDISAEVVHSRGEELGKNYREAYDLVCARAVAALPVLTELCLPLVKIGGKFLALKSVNEGTELSENSIRTLGGEIEKVVDYKLPNGDDRRLIIIRKITHTPTKYPRSFAKISKKPL